MSIWEGQHKCETLLCSCFFLSLSHHVVLCPLFPLKSFEKKKDSRAICELERIQVKKKKERLRKAD